MSAERTRPRDTDDEAQAPPALEAPAEPRAAAGACVACGHADEQIRCAHCGAARRAGGFTIERVLHTSERGRVYVARDGEGRRVALKELVFATVPDAAAVDAFLREGRLLEGLSNPGIPRFVASFREGAGIGTRLYLAQEFVDGEPLSAELGRRRFGEGDARRLARSVLTTLAYLHGRSPMVVHRDVKPANLVRRRDGSVALVDFDAARGVRPEGTHRATVVGTFGYMPIEQLGGSVDATVDLYALGATLVHLMTGTPPHDLLTPEYALDFEHRLKASAGFRAWLRRMVARTPADRFASAKEAIAALDIRETKPRRETRPASAPPASSRPPQKQQVRRAPRASVLSPTARRALVVGSLFSFLGVLVGAGIGGPGGAAIGAIAFLSGAAALQRRELGRPSTPPSQKPARKRRRKR